MRPGLFGAFVLASLAGFAHAGLRSRHETDSHPNPRASHVPGMSASPIVTASLPQTQTINQPEQLEATPAPRVVSFRPPAPSASDAEVDPETPTTHGRRAQISFSWPAIPSFSAFPSIPAACLNPDGSIPFPLPSSCSGIVLPSVPVSCRNTDGSIPIPLPTSCLVPIVYASVSPGCISQEGLPVYPPLPGCPWYTPTTYPSIPSSIPSACVNRQGVPIVPPPESCPWYSAIPDDCIGADGIPAYPPPTYCPWYTPTEYPTIPLLPSASALAPAPEFVVPGPMEAATAAEATIVLVLTALLLPAAATAIAIVGDCILAGRSASTKQRSLTTGPAAALGTGKGASPRQVRVELAAMGSAKGQNAIVQAEAAGVGAGVAGVSVPNTGSKRVTGSNHDDDDDDDHEDGVGSGSDAGEKDLLSPAEPTGPGTMDTPYTFSEGAAMRKTATHPPATATTKPRRGAILGFAEVKFWVIPATETTSRICKRMVRRAARRSYGLPGSTSGAIEEEEETAGDAAQATGCVPRPPKKLKMLLNAVTGAFRPATLNCITGPSGCGKSTLLLLLSGRATSGVFTGVRAINGHVMGSAGAFDRLARDVVGFLPQSDTLPEHLTARQVLVHARALAMAGRRLDFAGAGSGSALGIRMRVGVEAAMVGSGSHAAGMGASGALVPWCGHGVDVLKAWADATLADLGLSEAGDTVVGGGARRGLSGGQRRRLSLGVVLAREPSVIACDEVSSGLDASSALAVMQSLKRIAVRGNRTVVCVLHQPRTELWELLDDALVLGKGGIQHYFGPVAGVVPILARRLRTLQSMAQSEALSASILPRPQSLAVSSGGSIAAHGTAPAEAMLPSEAALQDLIKQPDVMNPGTYANPGDWVSDVVGVLDGLAYEQVKRGDLTEWTLSLERATALANVRRQISAIEKPGAPSPAGLPGSLMGAKRRGRLRRSDSMSRMDKTSILDASGTPAMNSAKTGQTIEDAAVRVCRSCCAGLRSSLAVSGWRAMLDDATVAFARRWRFYTGEWTSLAGLLVQEAVVSLILAAAFLPHASRFTSGPWTDDAYAVSAFTTLVASYACVAAYLHIVPRYFAERPMLQLERAARTMSYSGYVLGVTLAEFPMAVLETAAILGATYGLVNMNPDPRVAVASGLILVVTVLAWQAQMGLLNALTDSLEVAYTFNFLALGLATIYGGVLVRPSETPWPFLVAYYAVAPALGFRAFLQNDLQCCYMTVTCDAVAVSSGPIVDAIVDSARRDNPEFSALGGRLDTAALLVSACESFNVTSSSEEAFTQVSSGLAPPAGEWGSPLVVGAMSPANASVNLGAIYLANLEILDVVDGEPGSRNGVANAVPADTDVFRNLHGMGYDQLTMNIMVLLLIAIGFRILQVAVFLLRESCKGRAVQIARTSVKQNLLDGDFERSTMPMGGALRPDLSASTGAAGPTRGPLSPLAKRTQRLGTPVSPLLTVETGNEGPSSVGSTGLLLTQALRAASPEQDRVAHGPTHTRGGALTQPSSIVVANPLVDSLA